MAKTYAIIIGILSFVYGIFALFVKDLGASPALAAALLIAGIWGLFSGMSNKS